MTTTTNPGDKLNFDEGKPGKLPSTLNVLTILTFIGCAWQIIGGIWQYFRAEKGYKDLVDAQAKMGEAPAWAKKMMGPEMLEMARKSMEYKLPLLILGLVGAGLCLYGAMEMRKLKKQGYLLWLAGEVLPLIGSIFLLGMGAISGFAAIGFAFPVLFIVLYTMQRKHLVN